MTADSAFRTSRTSDSGAAVGAPATDDLTVVAVSVLAFIVSNVMHEGLGHGGACLLVGGKPVALTAVYFDSDSAGLSDAQGRWIAAGGPLVNLLTGLVGLGALRGMRGWPGPARLFVWLLATLGLFMATGYLLFSGVGGIGDLAVVTAGLRPAWAWRVGLAVVGAATYFLAAQIAARAFARMSGSGGEALVRRGSRIAGIAYATGAAVVCCAGLLNPKGFFFVLVSAVASSVGGASGLLWMMQLLHGTPPAGASDLELPRSRGWIVAAAVALVVYVAMLGPGLRF